MQKYMNKKVKEMAVDDAVEGFFLLKNPVPKTTQSGKNFLSFKLADASGEIEGIFWDCPQRRQPDWLFRQAS